MEQIKKNTKIEYYFNLSPVSITQSLGIVTTA